MLTRRQSFSKEATARKNTPKRADASITGRRYFTLRGGQVRIYMCFTIMADEARVTPSLLVDGMNHFWPDTIEHDDKDVRGEAPRVL